MTRLVVHPGTHATDWWAMQRQLVRWRAPLAALGMRLHPADDPGAWLSSARSLAEGRRPRHLVEAARRAVRDEAPSVLVSSEKLEDAVRDRARLANLADFARGLGMSLTVLVVVRDQLGYLNWLYCDRIAHLQTARDFASFVADPSPAARFDYATAFGHVHRADDIDLVAVPYSAMRPGAQAKAVLVAAGVPAGEVERLAETHVGDELPGPVQVAATRLLFKRLWRLGLLDTVPRRILVEVTKDLGTQADDRGWDDEPFWGWDPSLRDAAIARYRPSNDAFAAAVWGRPWGDSWETGEYVDVDLPASAPGLVVDVLGTVDLIVKQVRAAKPAGDPGELCQNAGE